MQEDKVASQNEQEALQRLRELILREDRESFAQLRDMVQDARWFEQKANPLIEEHIEYLKKNFPKEFNKVVERIVDKRIKDSQAAILDTIYPVLGMMIKKYVNHQFQELKEAIDRKVKEVLDAKRWRNRLKVWFLGVNNADLVLSDLGKPVIEEIFVIQRDSGLIIGNASITTTIDREAIAGMLTAIKSFVEDAFQREKEDLELIAYASYKIMLHNYHSYYLAVVLSGPISYEEQTELRDRLQDFAREVLVGYQYATLDEVKEEVSKQLYNHFMEKKEIISKQA